MIVSYKNAIPCIYASPEEETKSLSDLTIAHLLLTGEVPDPEIDACDQTKNDYPLAITIASSFCRTNLLEPEEGGEEPELEVELSKLNHLCAAIRQIFLLSKDVKGESKKKNIF